MAGCWEKQGLLWKTSVTYYLLKEYTGRVVSVKIGITLKEELKTILKITKVLKNLE